jgi:uncharacterized protein YjbJ (UPF0337 family)
MRSAREDSIRGGIDKFAGRVLQAVGTWTRSRTVLAAGRAARARGAGRSAKGRLKRRAG